jgi:hypothetical protein
VIHQAWPSQGSVLGEFFFGKVSVKERFSSERLSNAQKQLVLDTYLDLSVFENGKTSPTFLLENLPLHSTELYKKLGAKLIKKELNFLASKRWEKAGRQELHSTPYKQEIDPWCLIHNAHLMKILIFCKNLDFKITDLKEIFSKYFHSFSTIVFLA